MPRQGVKSLNGNWLNEVGSRDDVFEQEARERTEGNINHGWTQMDTDLGKAER